MAELQDKQIPHLPATTFTWHDFQETNCLNWGCGDPEKIKDMICNGCWTRDHYPNLGRLAMKGYIVQMVYQFHSQKAIGCIPWHLVHTPCQGPLSQQFWRRPILDHWERVVAFGYGLDLDHRKFRMRGKEIQQNTRTIQTSSEKCTKNWQHLSLERYSQSLSQRGWVIFPWAKPAWQNGALFSESTGFLPFCCVMWLMWEVWDSKTVRFTCILDTFWHCAISWVGRSGGKILVKHVHFLLSFENWNWLSGRNAAMYDMFRVHAWQITANMCIEKQGPETRVNSCVLLTFCIQYQQKHYKYPCFCLKRFENAVKQRDTKSI